MSAPYIGFPTATAASQGYAGAQAQPAGAEWAQSSASWAQAAQQTAMTGRLPPGITPGMLQQERVAAQEQMMDYQKAQQEMAMTHIHKQASLQISNADKMDSSLANAANVASGIADSIGSLGDKIKPKDGSTNTASTSSTSDSSESTTPTTATSLSSSTNTSESGDILSKTDPANFTQAMDSHLSHMDPALMSNPMTQFGAPQAAMQTPMTHFGTTMAAPQSPMHHFGTTSGTVPTSGNLTGLQMGAQQQAVPIY